MKNLFLLSLFLSGFFGQAQYTAIPDPNFEQALIDLGIDSGVIDGKVLTATVSGIFSLNVEKKTITDLTGIQDFLSLTTLNCNQNQLTSLDVTKNTILINLDCGFNKITSLDVTKNTGLSSFNCGDNQISSLDVTKNTVLNFLYCDYNQISSLEVTKNTALNFLYCDYNQISSLDLTKNMVLTYLSCDSNQISNLDVTNNMGLTYLSCGSNQISSLDVTKNVALTGLNCANNPLTSLNLKNGNNSIITGFGSKSNPNLTCIQVDNKAYSDANWSNKKDATASYSENCSKTTNVINPPVITATGNQTYCPGTSLKIIETISITNDPAEPDTDAVYIQISSGYINGQDQLILTNPTAHPTITTSWDAAAGKLKLYSPLGIKVSYTDFVSAIKDVEFSNSSPAPSGIRNFSINLGQANFLPSTGHYYQYVSNTGITWTNAKTAAETSTYYGLKGYLATILSADEAKLSGEQASGAGWIGGSDEAVEGIWKWITGPEGLANGGTGIVFWNGTGGGSTPNFAYWNTNNNEPNQSGNEDYAHITAPGVGIPGSWNDLSNTGGTSGNYQPKGYIVEYGGMPGDPSLQISASTTITIPKITSTTPASRCDSGSLTLQATATDGTVNWYTSITNGILLHTGNSYTIPNLATTTTYYVDASNGSCSNPRTPITATINTTPTITSTAPASRCDSGTVTLGAIASAGTINWYDAPTAGTLLGTGTSFTTPNITSTTTYYVDATASGCKTSIRTAIMATVNISPTITSTAPASRCDTGSVTLGATASTGTINWYDVSTGGTSLGTGTAFTTPSITSTTTYYVDATASGCTTPTRTAIIATINILPTITSTEPASRCDSGTVTLGATASGGTINWYDVPTGGVSLGNGNTFTTPSITSTTTYYVDATASGCTTPTRTAITATVNASPSITSTTPASRCDSGTVTLGATASTGTINWYDVPTGGTSLGTGSSFTTPYITSTTTYYVDATTTGCPSPRLPVEATVYPILIINEEVLLCQSEAVTLDASISGMSYLWSPGGETNQTIVVSSIGDYSVIISSPLANCDSKKDFKVIEHPKPIINAIIVNENSITIQLENPETYYEFSIDGELFKDSNQFSRIPSGQYTAYVREKNGCNLVQQDFTIFTIAKYFTPNNDGHNDLWEIKEMRDYPNSRVEIFNRYGKLLKQINSGSLGWNGKFNGVELPADDYWYVLKMEDSKPEIKGHFSLKR